MVSILLLLGLTLATRGVDGLNLKCLQLAENSNHLEVTLKKDSFANVTFSLEESDDGGEKQRTIDFNGNSRMVPLRINFRKFNETFIEVMTLSMRENAMTSGLHDVSPITKKRDQTSITVRVLVQEREFEIDLYGRSPNDWSSHEILWTHTHTIPDGFHFQDVGSIVLSKNFQNLKAKVCSVTDKCEAICVTCPPGTKMISVSGMEAVVGGRNGSVSCMSCQAGYYTQRDNEESCSPCRAGTKSNYDFGSTSCKLCSTGQVSEKGATACFTCASGSKVNATTCTCRPGTHRVSRKSCYACGEGEFARSPNMDQCVVCEGTVVDGGKECECGNGEMAADNGSCGNEDECPEGAIRMEDGTCKDCAPGSYATKENKCVLCNRGKYQDMPGQTFCKPCSPGTYQGLVGGTSCVGCSVNSYQDQEGQTKCISCNSGIVRDNQCIETDLGCAVYAESLPNIGTLNWFEGSSGEMVTLPCPYGGMATKFCTNKGTWTRSNVSGCLSKASKEINKIIEDSDDSEKVKRIGDFVTTSADTLAPSDLDNVVVAVHNTTIESPEAAENVLKVALGLAGYQEGLQESVSSDTKHKVVSLLESGLSFLAKSGEANVTALTESLSNSDVTVSIASEEEPSVLPNNQKVSIDARGKFSTIIYHNSKLFPTPSDSLSSPILGVNHYGDDPVMDVRLTMALAEDARTECRWYNPEQESWSTSGCYITRQSESDMICQCNHLTSFAAFTSLSEVPERHQRAQSTLSTLLFITSIILCLITMALYLPIRTLRSKPIIKIEMMELFSLVLANTTFLLLSRLHHQSHLCEGMVFALHYFYLVTMAWSFIAALTFYTQIVRALHSYGTTTSDWAFLRYNLGCWTVPVLFPLGAILYSRSNPNTPYVADLDGEFGCWMNPTWKIYTFVLPMLCVVGINTFLAIRVIIVMLQTKQNKKDANSNRRHVKSIVCLLTLFGTSFLLALFTYGPQAVVFQYLFILLTCSQGIVIFVLFVPLRPEVHGEWMDFLSRNSVVSRSSRSSPLSARTSDNSLSSSKTSSAGKFFARRDTDLKLNTLHE